MLKEALFYRVFSKEEKTVQCNLCPHNCIISLDKFGLCGVRKNIEGKLYTLVYNKPVALHVDPIEKKPLYHFFPGSLSFSLATLGCNFKCVFCQNWEISQERPEFIGKDVYDRIDIPKEKIVQEAKKNKCKSISYTYTEPTVFFEYAYDICRLSKEAGLYNNFVTNGYINPEPLKMVAPYLDAANVDLKSFSEDFYIKICKGRLQPVLDTIKLMKELGIWVEITTLLIPGLNDSSEEIRNIAEFIYRIDKDTPWHISKFHPDYKLLDKEDTPIEKLREAYKIGKDVGLRFIYLGNVWEGNDTYCFKCGKLLIKREYLWAKDIHIKNNRCPYCNTEIPGIFEDEGQS